MVGADATRAALLQALPGASHLHIACHGEFRPSSPLASRILLAGQDEVSLRDIGDAPEFAPLRGARLVTLSACVTALADFAALPDELIGLPSGFLRLGVAGVVGTLWPVHDGATALLMTKFYELHVRGDTATGEAPMSPPQALRRAQSWIRTLDAAGVAHHLGVAYRPGDAPTVQQPYAHPLYWAPFVFVGS